MDPIPPLPTDDATLRELAVFFAAGIALAALIVVAAWLVALADEHRPSLFPAAAPVATAVAR